MPPSLPDYYGILGVASSATPEDIKKRYRELARRYHPDVAKAANAAGMFKEINEANRVLSNPDTRARYDSELKLARLTMPQAEKRRTGERETKSPPEPNRAPNAQRPTSAGRPHPNAPSTPPGVLEQAQNAFAKMKYREAEALCRQALRTYGRSASIYEILGDICRVRGRTDEAIAMYSYALQLDRANRSIQTKFDKLVGRPSGATMAGTAARATRRTAPGGRDTAPAMSAATAVLNVVGLLLMGLLVYLGAQAEHAPATNWKVFAWDPLLLFSLSVSGALLGFLMSLNGIIGIAKAELAMAGPAERRVFPTPLGLLLLVYSVVLFYAGLVYYLLVGFFKQAVSKSVLSAFVACFVLLVTFALLEQTSRLSLLLFGGSVVFVGFVVGWSAGDQIRK